MAFPGTDVAIADLERLLVGRSLPELSEERAVEVFLAYACALGDEAAIGALDRRYLAGVARALQRGRSHEIVADAVQQLVATVLLPRRGRPPEIADFTGSGPLAGWLRIVALRILLRLERRDRRAAPIDLARAPVPPPDDPEFAYLRRRYNAALQEALADAWSAMAPETRVLLRLRYRDGVGIDEIAAMENVHRATAARRLRRAEDLLTEQARALLRTRLGASDLDIDSMVRAIRSRIEISLSGIVRA
ncbi:MAG TPA: sigma factor-like helix-turn-helix DNA-binding protein [Haliangiales bacterium]|nr:sigma factor-like helix-turn-helix DNA-binding protein [Haliangiales bacterium]